MSGLAEVLAKVMDAHLPGGDWHCTCGEECFGGSAAYSWTLFTAHRNGNVTAAATTWLTERLASEEVREAVVRAIYGDGLDGAPEIATAALTAVTEALRGPA